MRHWISLFLFYATVLVILTGLVLYFMPPGRVAYWTDWRFLGWDKDQWESIHILFGFLMIVLAGWHLYLNWKPFKRYLGSLKSPRGAFISVTLATVLLLALSVKDLPPASWLMALRAHLKASWGQPPVPPPIPHAELLSLEALLKREKIPAEKALPFLKKHGIKVPSIQMSLKELARINRTTPADLYLLLLKSKKNAVSSYSIFQPGRKTLAEVCRLLELPRETCQQVLENHGIQPDWEVPLRELAFAHGATPRQIIEWLKKAKEARK